MAPRRKTTTAAKTKTSKATKATRTVKSTRKKKTEMEYSTGKFETVDEKQAKAKSVEDLLSVPNNPFGTNSFEDLESSLEGMNLRQMQELAVKASIFPSGNKTSLRNKIRREFKVKFGTKDGSNRYDTSSESPIVDPKSKLAKEVLDILNGR
tara:strand:- start:519 stop:974 length:456 start_codon:yes stop_codon:yes gene_type:complete